MTDSDWQQWYVRCLGMCSTEDRIDKKDHLGDGIRDDTVLLLMNAQHEAIAFVLPEHGPERHWNLVLDIPPQNQQCPGFYGVQRRLYPLEGRSVVDGIRLGLRRGF
ncbi:MAG TPA: hypothetical protein PKD12_03950 [Nitrospira sp.]|nr:hypothetical protein [Nitrospira sp.]